MMKKLLQIILATTAIIVTCLFVVNAASDESKYEYHDSSWYLSVREAEAFMGFVYNLAPEDLIEKEFADLAIKLLSGQYADSPEDEYIIKMTFCEVALTQMNSKVEAYDHASVITSTNLINWLKGKVGENPTEDYANKTCNAYLDKIKEGIIKSILLGVTENNEELEITLKIESCYQGIKDIIDIPEKAKSYAQAIKAGLESIIYAGSSSRSAMYKYFLAYARTRDLANSTVDGFELAMNYNVFALVNQGLYDPFLNWADEDNQKVLNRWAELFYWLTKDVGGVEFTNDNTAGTTSSTLEPVEFVPGTGIAEGKCGEKVKWHLDASTGILTIYGKGCMDSYTSASKTPWYNYRQYINYIKVIDGVESIGNYAFAECTTLDKVYLAADVYDIGSYAFYNCVGMRLFVFDGVVYSIGHYAFGNCKNLVYFNIPDSIKDINNGVFAGCTGLVRVNVPETLVKIRDSSFASCTSLTEIELPEGLTTIGSSAFYGCTSLTTVGGIPSGVTYIGSYAFYNCSNLTDDIIIPEGVTEVLNYAFYGCQKIPLIKLHNGIITIGDRAFQDCRSITEISIPESVTNLPYGVFENCSGIKELTIPASIEHAYTSSYQYYASAFKGCTNIEKVTITKGTGTMFTCSNNLYTPWSESKAKLKEAIIEDGVTNIVDYAFYNCSALEKIELPDSITTIGNYAFYNCSKLAEITIPNKSCSIYDSSSTFNTKITIKAPCDSMAYDYAKKYNHSFVSTEHILTDWITDFIATDDIMTTNVYRKCTICEEAVDLTTHSATGWIIDAEPKCEVDGSKHLECLDCGYRYDVVIPATGHSEVIDESVAATCTTPGLTEGKHCSMCSAVILEQTVIDILGHDMSNWTEIKSATCTESGENKNSCSRCDYYETEVVGVLPHTEVIDKAIAATCTTTGLTEGKHCSVCNTVIVEQSVIDALGHNIGEWIETQSPTCTEYGEKRKECSRCNYYESDTIAMTSHTIVVDKAIAATCTSTGLTEGKHCSVCGGTITEQKVVNTTDHTYKNGTCTICGNKQSEGCKCNCHKGGLQKIVWGFLKFFYKLFKVKDLCECGVAHY